MIRDRRLPLLLLGIIFLLVSLLAACDQLPLSSTSEHPAEISGHVTIAEKIRVERTDVTPNRSEDIFWIVSISATNNAYENPMVSGYDDWYIIAGDDQYEPPRAPGISPSQMSVPAGQTGETMFRFNIPRRVQVSNARLLYSGQEPYSYGELSGGDMVVVYDWDSRAAVGGAGKGISTTLVIIIISVALIITAVIAISLHSKRCKNCGKWNAVVEIGAKEIERQEVSRKEIRKEYHRNSRGELIKTVEKEVDVPGVKVSYRVTKKCRFCGYVTYGYKIIQQ